MTSESFLKLYEITKKLRSEDGCPWDKKQTPSTLRETFIEETFEVIDAITEGDPMHAKEELGDAFFNIVLISYCYEQAGDFTISEVLDEISEKLVRRHPHVFGDVQADTAAKVIKQWDKIKEEVEGRKSDSVLDSVPNGFPPLLKAYKMLKKAAKKGFDWRSVEQAESKVCEELEEISGAVMENNREHLEEEVGDMLLAAVNYCRKLGIDPNVALEKATKKFSSRFRYVEKEMKERHLEMTESNDNQMLALWKEAKKR
ncbi:nucleoside triphosphate pyrophosphohydrolase [Treponema sp.]|uniref:nucleoside triphosphate pyrophosphohydrolase n=1 Tax=Treponema sp. TaxID=166 RepID=UPI00298E070C|nr:nucleoside triphosphate pyrophosphohydrolase [Treponema sp.]MCQ2242284.1 nucleoside triphosphate pyrophosphohydrolase [Treponema sp.]